MISLRRFKISETRAMSRWHSARLACNKCRRTIEALIAARERYHRQRIVVVGKKLGARKHIITPKHIRHYVDVLSVVKDLKLAGWHGVANAIIEFGDIGTLH